MKELTEYIQKKHVDVQKTIEPTINNFIAWVFDENDPFDFSIPMFTKLLDKHGFAHLYSGKTKYTAPPFTTVYNFISFLSANKNEKITINEKPFEDGRYSVKFSIDHDNTSNGYDGWEFNVLLDKSAKEYFNL